MQRATVNDESLLFDGQARETFAFLENEWGMRCVQNSSNLVRWENESTFVIVFLGPVYQEVDVALGARAEPAVRPYALAELIALADPDGAGEYRCPMVRTRSAVGRALAGCADLLRRHGQAAVHGDQGTLRLLRDNRDKAGQAWESDLRAAVIRPRAAEAFRRGAYREAVDLFGRMEESLTPAERAKLAYARRRAGH